MAKEGGPLPFRLQYTGYENLDIILCLMVSFFHPATHHAPIWQYTLDLVGSLPTELAPFLLDASSLVSNNRLAAILLPLVLGLVYSFKGGAVVLPVYWLFSMIVRSVQQSAGSIPRAPDVIAVQATAFALVLGYLIPAMLMFMAPTPKYIALWVLFPVTIAAAQVTYYMGAALGLGYILPSPLATQLSSYAITQLTYIGLGAFSIFTHLPLVFGIIFTSNPAKSAWNQLVPRMSIWAYETKEEFKRVGMQNEIQRFLQWDLIMIALATWLAGTWSWAFSSAALAVRVALISLAGCLVLGPGAVVGAVFITKEAMQQRGAAQSAPVLLNLAVNAIQRVLLGGRS